MPPAPKRSCSACFFVDVGMLSIDGSEDDDDARSWTGSRGSLSEDVDPPSWFVSSTAMVLEVVFGLWTENEKSVDALSQEPRDVER